MSGTPDLDSSLRVADEVLEVARNHGADAVLIGALALAVHNYPRDTTDLDLAVAIEPRLLYDMAAALMARGYNTVVRDPTPDDPLGGVLDVRSDAGDLIQVVNFLNPPSGGFPRLVADAIATSVPFVEGSLLRVVDLDHLIVFKLYAGGPKSSNDILALLESNPDLDLVRLQALCKSYRLDRALARVRNLAGR